MRIPGIKYFNLLTVMHILSTWHSLQMMMMMMMMMMKVIVTPAAFDFCLSVLSFNFPQPLP